MRSITQLELIKEYFTKHPRKDIPHATAVDWVVKEFKKRTGKVFRDPNRGIHSLAQKGFLIKISKGVYRYDPDYVHHRELEDFTRAQKEEILKKDNYKCVICGKSSKDGIELHVDHIKPKDLGGNAIVENGQTLCAQHNFLKKNFKQTETGKKMFIRLYELAKAQNDENLKTFCKEILEVFERNNMNGHIEWEK